MKIDILCGEGSQNGVHLSDIYGADKRVGVGGSEYALLTMCEHWTKEGHDITLYNNPKRDDGVFKQRATHAFTPRADRDILITFRQPNEKSKRANGKKIFWSCDQYTVGNFADFAQWMDKTVSISPYHTEYLKKRYGIDAVDIDLPVRMEDYDADVKKVSKRIIFTSVPDRGLGAVARMFPLIKRHDPEVSLVVTSDYRLWGVISPQNSQYKSLFFNTPDVEFLGAIPRERLVEEQMKADVHLYPFTGDTEELFCVSLAESQVAGALPIASTNGALGTTNMGIRIDVDAKDRASNQVFAEKVVESLNNPDLPKIQKDLSAKARERFDVKRIMKLWDEKVFNG